MYVYVISLVTVLEVAICQTPAVADPGFPRGGCANHKGGGANLLFLPIFPKNCMKLKKFGLGGGASLAPPFGSANGQFSKASNQRLEVMSKKGSHPQYRNMSIKTHLSQFTFTDIAQFSPCLLLFFYQTRTCQFSRCDSRHS